jgi:hypothetical protein
LIYAILGAIVDYRVLAALGPMWHRTNNQVIRTRAPSVAYV